MRKYMQTKGSFCGLQGQKVTIPKLFAVSKQTRGGVWVEVWMKARSFESPDALRRCGLMTVIVLVTVWQGCLHLLRASFRFVRIPPSDYVK